MSMSRTNHTTVILFCFTGVVLCLSRAPADEPRMMTAVMADLVSAEGLGKWEVRGSSPPTRWELSAEHASHGTRCARLATPAYSPPDQMQRWPAVTLSDANLPVHDWAPYEFVVFDAYNPGEVVVPLRIHTDGPAGRWQRALIVRPGRQTVRVRLSGTARTNSVRTFHFFYHDPHKRYTLFLDGLRLETCDLAQRMSRLQAGVSRALRQADSIAPGSADLADDLRGLRQRAAALSAHLGTLSLERPTPGPLAWLAEVAAAETRLGEIGVVLSGRLFEAAFTNPVWGYGWLSGVEKGFREGRPFDGQIGEAGKVELAANESEGVQLVLRSKVPLKNVRVSVSELVSDDGVRMDADQIEVLPVGYVNTKRPPYFVSHVGWWPDPLLSFMPAFDLDAAVYQPVWLDVRTTPSQHPGRYAGTVTVSADDAPTLRVPLVVVVWGFRVPVEHHFPTAVTFWDKTLRPLYSNDPAEWGKFMAYCREKADGSSLGAGEARRLFEIRRACHDMLLAHRLVPDNIYRSVPPRIDDVVHWRERGVRMFNISCASEGPEKMIELLDEYVPKLKRAGLLDMAYIYSWDETDPIHFPAIAQSFGAIKAAYPMIPLMTTARDHSLGGASGLADAVDIWVPETDVYEQSPDAISAARERGCKVFWYTCMFPHHPYANWFIEGSAAEHRLLMGFMPFRFRCDGFVHYSLNLWKAPPEGGGGDVPWTEVLTTGPLTNSDGRSHGNYNGDGVLFYPGPDGPVPSIRLKCVRDGLEDYEYLWLLRRGIAEVEAGRRSAPTHWLARARVALDVDASVVTSLAEYSSDAEQVLGARRAIARLLCELAPDDATKGPATRVR